MRSGGLGAPHDRPIAIRLAQSTDIPALLAIENRSFASDRMNPRGFRHLLTRAHAACLVATARGEIAGYAAVFFRRNAKVARLHSLAVDPAAHGGGIGRALLDAIERAARARRQDILRLAVRTDNPAAISLYRSHGFKELKSESAYYSDGMSALTMEKVVALAK